VARPHLQRLVVDGSDAQRVGSGLARDDGAGILKLHQFHVPGIGAGGGRIGGVAPSIDEIACGHRAAVRPDGLWAQGKRVDQPFIGDGKAGGHTRHNVAVGVLIHQALEQVARDVSALDILGQAGVD